MARSLAAVLAAVALSTGMAIGVGAGVASADRSTRGHSHSQNPAHRNVVSGADTDSQELLSPELENVKNDPNRRKQLLDLLQNSVVHN